jgi:hypothetical protein
MSAIRAIAERVAAGAAFLDEHDPDWWRADVERAIDLNRLDFASGETCVLGQRSPLPKPDRRSEPYTAYVRYGFVLSGLTNADELWDWGVPLGITAPLDEHTDPDAVHDDLTAEWKRVITERRAAS